MIMSVPKDKQLLYKFLRSNKFIILKYLLRKPSFSSFIFKRFRPSYFFETLVRFQNDSFESCLYDFLPKRFLNYFNEGDFPIFGQWLILYWIVRRFKPEIVIETGVDRGASSAHILCAMHENHKGHLYSIDISKQVRIGELVPEYLKNRWTLIIGNSKNELPKILEELKSVDMFFHDSLHTYKHMTFEYEMVWPYIKRNGFLLSHDIFSNDAFMNFCKKKRLQADFYWTLGIIKK